MTKKNSKGLFMYEVRTEHGFYGKYWQESKANEVVDWLDTQGLKGNIRKIPFKNPKK